MTEQTAQRRVRLSKSKYQTGLQCPLRLWFSVHERELADPLSYSSKRRFERGSEIGVLAQGLWPDGVTIEATHLQPLDALEQTREALAAGAPALFEAAFEHEDVFVRVDALERLADGRWRMVEVKSSTKMKDEHVTDIAVQKWVLEGAGLEIASAELMHLDNTYVWDGTRDADGRPVYDLARLFAAEDATALAEAYQPQVAETAAALLAMLHGAERPEAAIGSRCTTPYDCDFRGTCHSCLPEQYPVTLLPFVTGDQLDALIAAGVLDIRDIPDTFRLQARQVERIRPMLTGEPEVLRDPRSEFARWRFPLLFLDFEDFQPALPLYPGTRPYQYAIPFQYSLHVLHADGRLEQRGYLHTGSDDPRPEWIAHLLADLGDTGTIVHYSHHESTVIGKVADACPEHAEALLALRPRMADLEKVVAACIGHPGFIGRTSMKQVLPALAGEDGPTYHGKRIANGEDATTYYHDAVTGFLSPEDAAAVFADLEAYCAVDTLGMVEVYRALAGVREAGGRLVLA
ncbi:MAG: DUF2779 domain-containing protein [Actinobacteria bacterium]|nr:MAG: DUF2779 domain-containing protein [Actinomycetota bacterium]